MIPLGTPSGRGLSLPRATRVRRRSEPISRKCFLQCLLLNALLFRGAMLVYEQLLVCTQLRLH